MHSSQLIQLNGPSIDADRLAFIIEPADENIGLLVYTFIYSFTKKSIFVGYCLYRSLSICSAEQSVCVRDVVETQPEQRLSRFDNSIIKFGH